MKRFWKIFAFSAVLALSLALFAACDDTPQTETEPVFYDITFDSAGGTAIAPQTIRGGGRIYRPQDPEKNGFGFVDWYYNGEPYRFRNKVDKDMTLVAEWGPMEAVVSENLEIPEGWELSSFDIKDKEGNAVTGAIEEYDDEFCFVNEGEYFFYESGKTEVIGHYLISDFTISLRDFDKAGQMSYAERDFNGESVMCFRWDSAVYQPWLYLSDDTFTTMQRYCEVKGYNVLRVNIFPIQLDNGAVVCGKWCALNTWTTCDFPIASLTEFSIWSQSQGLTEHYFTVEFLYDEAVEKTSLFDDRYYMSGGKVNDGNAVLDYGTYTAGEKTGEFYRWTSNAYQPYLAMNKTFAEQKAEWTAAGYDAVKISVYPILNENMLVLGGVDAEGNNVNLFWCGLNQWSEERVIPIGDYEGIFLWSQSSAATDVYFTIEPCMQTAE